MSADPKGLGAMFDAHTDAEFKTRDLEATRATMAAAPHVTHIPTMTGGAGRAAVRRFYETWFIGHWPEDIKVEHISRTAGEDRVVDEVMLSFTNDCEMPAILPSIKPTGRKVTIPFVVVVGFEGGKVAFERIYWDRAAVEHADPGRLTSFGRTLACGPHGDTTLARLGLGGPCLR